MGAMALYGRQWVASRTKIGGKSVLGLWGRPRLKSGMTPDRLAAIVRDELVLKGYIVEHLFSNEKHALPQMYILDRVSNCRLMIRIHLDGSFGIEYRTS